MTLPGKVSEHEIREDPMLLAEPVRVSPRMRARRGIALLVYSTGYPLLGLALWMGASAGRWVAATVLVALGVVMSFLGWALLPYSGDGREGAGDSEGDGGAQPAGVFVALYSRTGAIVIVLASYTVAASSHGWPMPQSVLGWFALVWIPLFVAFTLPVRRASPPRDSDR